MTKIKICGLSRQMDIDFVNEALPDYVGFVFADSKRQVSEAGAKELKSRLKAEIPVVGVFVNEDTDKIIRLCREKIIDMIQLHGDEGMDYIKALRKELNTPIIKAVRVKNQEHITLSEQLDSEFLLLDAYKEGVYGGIGESFDWSLIQQVKKPYFLAGGINKDNIIRAIDEIRPYAVDVSSGVETNGVKDRDKIIEIIKKVRSVR